MPTVADLSDPYGNFMVGPRHGPDVCDVCFTFTDGYQRCYVCARHERMLDAVAPISYSVAHEQLHHVLATYKRLHHAVARQFAIQLAAVLWRFLACHERCLAGAVGKRSSFDLVATVPSGARERDQGHPLQWIVGELVGPTADRYERLLARSPHSAKPHELDPERFTSLRRLDGESVLLVDDTWTTGANAQSAATALKVAGAGPVAAVVVGRHLNREWGDNEHRLSASERPFRWDECAFCTPRTRVVNE
jgi:predicted amidophosphoribosyltransferase